MALKPIGIIDPDRLKLMPKSCHAAHEFCFRLHDQMAQLLKEGEAHEIDKVIVKLSSEDEARNFSEAEDGLTLLLNSGYADAHKRIVLNHVIRALFSDFLHFTYESLRTLEKRKFAVSMALLRKPLRENLMFATWLKADSEDFYQRLKSSPADLMESNHLTPQRRKSLINGAIKNCKGMDFASVERIYAIVYDKSNDFGLATLFDKANHLVTSHPKMRTEELNLNFIFKNPNDNDFYHAIHADLAYLLMYANVLMISLYSEMSQVEDAYSDYILMTSLGSYASLFGKGRNPMADELNRVFREFLNCPHCGSRVRISKSNAPHFFIAEVLDCQKCGLEHTFPLHWLMSKTKFKLTDDRQTSDENS
jgi:hypothetical protein